MIGRCARSDADRPRLGRAALLGRSRRGSAALLVVAAILIAMVLLAMLFVRDRTAPVASSPGSGASATTASSAYDASAAPTAPIEGAETPRALATRGDLGRTVSDSKALLATDRFEGRARVRGVLTTDPPGVPIPRRWTLTLRPSSVLSGGELATTLTREFENGETRFEIVDVPLGGYELVVDALPLDSPRQQLLLAKPDSTDVFVQLVAHPAGSIEGRVIDRSGRTTEGLEVILVSSAGDRRATSLDRTGSYRFESVPDGTYFLHVGSVDNPIAPRMELVFTAPRMTVPDVALPALAMLRMRVLDQHEKPVEAADLVGYGSAGGTIRATTDASGLATVPYLPAGVYTLHASHASRGSKRQRVTISADDAIDVTIRLEP